MEESNNIKYRIKFYIIGYIIGYVFTFIYNGFSIVKAFPVNVMSVFCSIGLGGAIYYGTQENGIWGHIPEIIKHVFVSVGVIFVLTMILTLIHDSLGVNVKPFIGI